MRKAGFVLALLSAFGAYGAVADEAPVVVELFTSQGCSSCPPADALLGRLAEDPSLLALSFHVHYWDYLGWKDPFSSEENTRRQRAYASSLGDRVYTPQMVVDGAVSLVGSDERAVRSAIARAKQSAAKIPVTLAAAGGALDVRIPAASGNGGVWEVRFRRRAVTAVGAGENAGRTIANANNVTALTRLGAWGGEAWTHRISPPPSGDEGVAVLLQDSASGRILGAAAVWPSSQR